jgi:hypothetical protein
MAAETIIDTLITRFGFKPDPSGIHEAKGMLNTFKSHAMEIFGTLGALIGGGMYLGHVADAADETLKFADAVGVTVESLSELEYVTKKQGGSAEGLRGALYSLNRIIGEVERGVGRSKKAFEAYHISIKDANGHIKTADQLLLEVNGKFSSLSREKQFDLAAKMGIDSGAMKLMQTSPKVIEELMGKARQFGVLTRQEAESAAKYKEALVDISTAFKKVGYVLGAAVFEPMSKFFDLIASGTAFLREHSQFIKILTGVIGVMAVAIFTLTDAFITEQSVAAMAWIITFAPIAAGIIAITALVAIVAMVIDEFTAFFKGQDSYIGDLVKKYPMLGDVIYGIADVFRVVWESWKLAFDYISSTIVYLYHAFAKFGSGVKEIFSALWQGIKPFMQPIAELVESIKGIGGKAGGAIKTAMNYYGLKSTKDIVEGNHLQPAPVSTAHITAGHTSKTNNIHVGEVKVNVASGDSKEIAQNVGKALQDQLQNTVQDFDSPIKR